MAFFKNNETVIDEDKTHENTQMETSAVLDRSIDPEKDLQLDFDKTYTQYVRFNGRNQDENLDIDDTISILLPANMQSTNVL